MIDNGLVLNILDANDPTGKIFVTTDAGDEFHKLCRTSVAK